MRCSLKVQLKFHCENNLIILELRVFNRVILLTIGIPSDKLQAICNCYESCVVSSIPVAFMLQGCHRTVARSLLLFNSTNHITGNLSSHCTRCDYEQTNELFLITKLYSSLLRFKLSINESILHAV